MPKQIPLVDYLALEPEPHLVAHECTACGARYFDRRNACAGCFGTEFRDVVVATTGEVRAFTIVSLAAPGIPVPFVAAASSTATARACAPTSSTPSPTPTTCTSA